MSMGCIFKKIIVSIIAVICCSPTLAGDFENYTGPYLGQTPPGDTAELFAPGLFTAAAEPHDCPVFSSDGLQMYWGLMEGSQGILYSEYKDGRWTDPAIVPFHDEHGFGYTLGPCLSPDGARLFFCSYDPPSTYKIAGADPYWEYKWYVERRNGRWSDPKPLDSAVNARDTHWQFSVTGNNSLYISSEGHLWKALYSDDHFQPPVVVGRDSLDASSEVMTPYIAPDESYLLLAKRTEHARTDLYASYRIDNSTWSVPVSLGGGINTPGLELCPNVTPDGKYLFYLSNTADYMRPYWIDAGIIDKMKPDYLQ